MKLLAGCLLALMLAAPVAAGNPKQSMFCSVSPSVAAYGDELTITGSAGKYGYFSVILTGEQEGFLLNSAFHTQSQTGQFSVTLASPASVSGDVVTVRIWDDKPQRETFCSYTVL